MCAKFHVKRATTSKVIKDNIKAPYFWTARKSLVKIGLMKASGAIILWIKSYNEKIYKKSNVEQDY